jgi:hypothetical protein
MSLGPSFDREGFEEENLRWCPRTKTGAEAAATLDLGTEDARVTVEGAEATTRRTDEGNISNVAHTARRRVRRVEREGADDAAGVDGRVRGCGGGWLLRMSAANPDLAAGR